MHAETANPNYHHNIPPMNPSSSKGVVGGWHRTPHYGSLFEWDRLRQLHNTISGNAHVLGKTTIHVLANHLIPATIILLTTLTVSTSSTAHYVVYENSVAFKQFSHFIPSLLYDSSNFMSKSYRESTDRSNSSAVVDVRVTDPASLHLHQYILSGD